KIGIATSADAPLFQQFKIVNTANLLLAQLENLKKYWREEKRISTPTSRIYNERQLQQKIQLFADTCQHPLLSLYAVHQLEVADNYLENRAFYQKLLKKWQPTQSASPYFIALQNQYNYLEFLHLGRTTQPAFNKWLIGTFISFLIFLVLYFYRKKFSKKRNTKQALSVQEQKVYELLQAGKSNKEISSALNIGVATVKSHVYKIYNKTGIRSRKEIRKAEE
ncbi:MAG: helix-turn-helix transcriptional regulator, partial [Bacteroidota bacterium]